MPKKLKNQLLLLASAVCFVIAIIMSILVVPSYLLGIAGKYLEQKASKYE